jgi:LSD1 subclass zinc finger protein
MSDDPRIRKPRTGRIRKLVTAFGSSLTVLLFLFWLASFSDTTQAQRRNRRQTRSSSKAGIDYSRFSHATEKHQAACNTCHKIPSRNWQRAGSFPDVIDYPDHDACVSCHRPQFFRGARPVICSICHVKVSPRDEARFAFRNPSSQRQFTIEFPHDKHQDVIARTQNPLDSKRQFKSIQNGSGSDRLQLSGPLGKLNAVTSATGSVFMRASFKVTPVDDKTKTYNNCTICHAGRENPSPPSGGWIDSFVPGVGTFKSVPTSHASCFNCHWRAQPPVSRECSGCHKLAKPYASVDSVPRLSMKFTHAREQHVDECTTCHINITRSASLRGLTPDVPITACTGCHNQIGKREDLEAELAKLAKDKNFVCTYCHTSDKGNLDPPASHYLVTGRKPTKRSEMQ